MIPTHKKSCKLLLSLVISLVILCIHIPNTSAFDFSDLYREILTFDEHGDLVMCTYDSIAHVPITYKTIGWTLKRKDEPIDSPGNICVTIPLTESGFQIDPTNPENKYTYFICSRDIIISRIASVSTEWLEELTKPDGTDIYLDAVMTVCHSGIPQGWLLHNGASSSGEVYNTLPGILGARPWGSESRRALGTHFNKSLHCNLYLPTPEVDTKLEYQYFHYDKFGPAVDLAASIYSDVFDVAEGIPTSENLSLKGSATPYGYYLGMEIVTGNKFYRVPVTVTYDLSWTDSEGNSESDTESVTYIYNIERTYSYRRIKEYQLYYVTGMTFQNLLLPGGSFLIPDNYVPALVTHISEDETDHLKDPQIPELDFDGGSIDGGDSRPSVPNEDFSSEAQAALGEILVKNDFFSIDGQVILSEQETEAEAPLPVLPEEADIISFAADSLTISSDFANTWYPSTASAAYSALSLPDGAPALSLSVSEVNSVTVHTPVICDPGISDDRWLNQMVSPELDKSSLILGEPFTVSILCDGTHRSIPGYGSRDYTEYASDRQVSFPFSVEQNGIRYDADTWISIGETAEFTLPVEVNEGSYTVSYRTLAENRNAVSEAMQLSDEYANLELSQYIAEGSIPVMVMGRIFDFHITDIHDYPRWQNIFSTPEAIIHRTDGYYIGHFDKNKRVRSISDIFTLPVIPGSNPHQPNGRTLSLGYSYRFSLTTIGNFYDDNDSLEFLCNFYYINKTTGTRIPVDLYYTGTSASVYSYLLPLRTSFILEPSNRKLASDTYAVQTWFASDYLPLHLYAVPKGTMLPDAGIHNSFWLSNGYLAVNYDIYARNGSLRHLDYKNQGNALRGCCNMWKQEGFSTRKTGSDGINYSLLEGDIIFYDLDHKCTEDYWFFGTH